MIELSAIERRLFHLKLDGEQLLPVRRGGRQAAQPKFRRPGCRVHTPPWLGSCTRLFTKEGHGGFRRCIKLYVYIPL